MGKLINRIPGSRLLIPSLPGSALRTHVQLLGKPHIQQAFSKPCRVIFISKDTHLVFSIYIENTLLQAIEHAFSKQSLINYIYQFTLQTIAIMT